MLKGHEKMSHKMKSFIEKILHALEVVIAITTLVVMIGLLGYEIYKGKKEKKNV